MSHCKQNSDWMFLLLDKIRTNTMRVMALKMRGILSVASDVVHLKSVCVIKVVLFHYLFEFSQSLKSIICLLVSHVEGIQEPTYLSIRCSKAHFQTFNFQENVQTLCSTIFQFNSGTSYQMLIPSTVWCVLVLWVLTQSKKCSSNARTSTWAARRTDPSTN